MVRKAVPQETQVEVLAACRRRCATCFGLNRDTGIKPGQIAHLDRDAANPSFDNLVFLCLAHHDQFDSRTSQSKGLTSDEVRRFRQELATAIEHAWREPITFGSAGVPRPDGVSGRWMHGDDFDSAEIEVERMPDNRLRVHGFALHRKTSDIGPNFGELDFEGDLIDQAVTFIDERRPGQSYNPAPPLPGRSRARGRARRVRVLWGRCSSWWASTVVQRPTSPPIEPHPRSHPNESLFARSQLRKSLSI
jgi:hypothetical protein